MGVYDAESDGARPPGESALRLLSRREERMTKNR
jgi:hypothetical protein